MVEPLFLFIHANNLRAGSDRTCISCWHVRKTSFRAGLFCILVKKENHSTQDSHVVPHHGTNWAALWLTAQIKRDAVLSESYGRGYYMLYGRAYMKSLSFILVPLLHSLVSLYRSNGTIIIVSSTLNSIALHSVVSLLHLLALLYRSASNHYYSW